MLDQNHKVNFKPQRERKEHFRWGQVKMKLGEAKDKIDRTFISIWILPRLVNTKKVVLCFEGRFLALCGTDYYRIGHAYS